MKAIGPIGPTPATGIDADARHSPPGLTIPGVATRTIAQQIGR